MWEQWLHTALAATLALAAGFALGSPEARPATNADADTEAHAPAALHGDLESEIVLERDGRDAVHVDREDGITFSIENRFGRRAVARYAVELADELGNEIQDVERSRPLVLEAGEHATFALPFPSKLAAGYYQFRITVVARAGDEFADTTLEIGVAFFDRVAHLLGDEGWLVESLANQGAAS